MLLAAPEGGGEVDIQFDCICLRFFPTNQRQCSLPTPFLWSVAQRP
jgi:hypothetical protein